jgi:hypothetical protein
MVAAARVVMPVAIQRDELVLSRSNGVDVTQLKRDAITDVQARLVLADLFEESAHHDVAELLRDEQRGPLAIHGIDRADVLQLWLDKVPARAVPLRKRIDSLTDAELAMMPAWVDRWTRIGLSTARADRPLFEAGAAACYRFSGLPVPRFAWCPAPVVAVMAGAIWARRAGELIEGENTVGSQVDSQVGSQVGSQVRSQVRSQVDSQVRSQVRSQVGSQVDSQVGSQVGSQVRSQVRSQVGSQVGSQVRSQVGSQVRSQVRSQVGSQVGSQVRSQVDSQVRSQVGSPDLERELSVENAAAVREAWWDYFGGQFWVGGWGWGNAYVNFMLDALGLDVGKNIELSARAYAATAMSACWWYPCRDVVFVSERPTVLERDKKGRLIVARWEWTDELGRPASWEVERS